MDSDKKRQIDLYSPKYLFHILISIYGYRANKNAPWVSWVSDRQLDIN